MKYTEISIEQMMSFSTALNRQFNSLAEITGSLNYAFKFKCLISGAVLLVYITTHWSASFNKENKIVVYEI